LNLALVVVKDEGLGVDGRVDDFLIDDREDSVVSLGRAGVAPANAEDERAAPLGLHDRPGGLTAPRAGDRSLGWVATGGHPQSIAGRGRLVNKAVHHGGDIS
jgi:hypothetical protein